MRTPLPPGPPAPPSAPLIGPAQVALMTGQVSIIVASCDDGQRPHLMRASGCRVADDRRRVTLLMAPGGSEEVLADLRANARIAVVFTSPSSNRTLQLKGYDAQVQPGAPGDADLAQRYLQGFTAEIGALGFPPHLAHTILQHDDTLLRVQFTVAAAFEQTPGPSAGEPLPPP